jgi:predicted RNA polymerase sigma factor
VPLYDALFATATSPVIAVNRALVLGERDDPQAALDALGPYANDPRLADYQPYWAACGPARRSATGGGRRAVCAAQPNRTQ